MLFMVVCEGCNSEYVCDFEKRPIHDSTIDAWSITNNDLRNRVLNQMGCFVKVKFSGSAWHPDYGELTKIELIKTANLQFERK